MSARQATRRKYLAGTGVASAMLLPFPYRPVRSNRPRKASVATTRTIDRVVKAEATSDGAGVRLNRVIAGTVGGVTGPVEGIPTNPVYLDVTLPPEARFELPVPREYAVAAYAFEGKGAFGNAGEPLAKQELAVFTKGDRVVAHTEGNPFRFLLLAGRPLNEPVARSGPFVMNTPEELEKAYLDYRNGTLGREEAQPTTLGAVESVSTPSPCPHRPPSVQR